MKEKKKLGLYIMLLGILVTMAQIALTAINESPSYIFLMVIGSLLTSAGLFTLIYQNRNNKTE